MSFDNFPKSNVYVLPPTDGATQDNLHYGVVQVSEYRYVVVEYDGKINREDISVLYWRTVSMPMKMWDAIEKAQTFRENRLKKRDD